MDELSQLGHQLSAGSLYYFFSSSAQAVAAIVGLSAALAIFRYQNLLEHINDGAENLVRYFSDAELFPFWPWEADGQQRYRGSATANGHLNVLRRYLLKSNVSVESRLKGNLEIAYKASPKEIPVKLGSFRALKLSFEKYDAMVRQARKLRWLTIFATTFGLFLVIISLGLTLSPDLDWLKRALWIWAFYAGCLVVYACLTIYLTMIAFADPLKDK